MANCEFGLHWCADQPPDFLIWPLAAICSCKKVDFEQSFSHSYSVFIQRWSDWHLSSQKHHFCIEHPKTVRIWAQSFGPVLCHRKNPTDCRLAAVLGEGQGARCDKASRNVVFLKLTDTKYGLKSILVGAAFKVWPLPFDQDGQSQNSDEAIKQTKSLYHLSCVQLKNVSGLACLIGTARLFFNLFTLWFRGRIKSTRCFSSKFVLIINW